ncbi:MAG: hypothetical protein U5N26_10910 [Candidatus Marinimicrobia bacterium]|nr:hypothetical protein [Candidatus Neomarinimicrobiota bacterium]
MLVFSAYLFGVYHYQDAFIWLYVFSVLGAVSGFMTMVYIGGYFGRHFFFEKNYRYTPRSLFEKAEEYFLRYGWGVILGNRLFFGMRPVIGLLAGMSEDARLRIFQLLTVSALVFNAGFMLLGIFLGRNWPLIESILRKYTGLTIVLTLLLILLFLWRIIRKRKKK